MSRLDELRARFEAEAAVLELEERLIAAKENGADCTDLKHELREARRAFRLDREGAASPATIETGVTVGGGE